jgi:hypothetical protein
VGFQDTMRFCGANGVVDFENNLGVAGVGDFVDWGDGTDLYALSCGSGSGYEGGLVSGVRWCADGEGGAAGVGCESGAGGSGSPWDYVAAQACAGWDHHAAVVAALYLEPD